MIQRKCKLVRFLFVPIDSYSNDEICVRLNCEVARVQFSSTQHKNKIHGDHARDAILSLFQNDVPVVASKPVTFLNQGLSAEVSDLVRDTCRKFGVNADTTEM